MGGAATEGERKRGGAVRAPRACSARRHVLLSGVCCCVTAFGPTVAPGANPLAFARMRRVPTTVAARVRRVGVGNQLLLHKNVISFSLYILHEARGSSTPRPHWLCISDLAAAGLSRCHSIAHKAGTSLKSRRHPRRARAHTHTPRPHAVLRTTGGEVHKHAAPETHLPRSQRACHGVEPGFGPTALAPGARSSAPARTSPRVHRDAPPHAAHSTRYIHPPAHMHPSVTCTMLMFHAHGVRCPASVARLA
jgi:hypothetical protein